MKQSFVYTVNGLEVRAQFDARDRDEIFLPLLRRLTELRRERGRTVVAFLAGPPAAGKSTLCRYLEELSRGDPALAPAQALGLDGFHYPQVYLDAHGLAGVKGAPQTYDVAKLARLLEHIGEPGQRWPVYDRRIHDPVEGAAEIRGEIVLLEGNWLLLNEPPWRELPRDYSVFLRAGEKSQLERVVARKLQGGFSEAEARAAAARNDWPNIQYCMEHSHRGDLNLAPAADGRWRVIQ